MTRSGTAQRMIQKKRGLGLLAVGGGIVHTVVTYIICTVLYIMRCNRTGGWGCCEPRVNNVHRDEPLLMHERGVGYEALTDESLSWVLVKWSSGSACETVWHHTISHYLRS